LVTDEVVSNLPIIKEVQIGLLHLFLKHTSAGLSLNENWDPDVLADLNDVFNRIVPDNS
jgi:secondary thiamine-phosphate synthase enzyme